MKNLSRTTFQQKKCTKKMMNKSLKKVKCSFFSTKKAFWKNNMKTFEKRFLKIEHLGIEKQFEHMEIVWERTLKMCL